MSPYVWNSSTSTSAESIVVLFLRSRPMSIFCSVRFDRHRSIGIIFSFIYHSFFRSFLVFGKVLESNASSVVQFGYIHACDSRYWISEFSGSHPEITRWTRHRIWTVKGNFSVVAFPSFELISMRGFQEEILAAAKHGERLLDDFRTKEIKEFSERTGNVSTTERWVCIPSKSIPHEGVWKSIHFSFGWMFVVRLPQNFRNPKKKLGTTMAYNEQFKCYFIISFVDVIRFSSALVSFEKICIAAFVSFSSICHLSHRKVINNFH